MRSEGHRGARARGSRGTPAGRSARPNRERKPREERWIELVEVATQVFYERGYDGASLQDIAGRLGMLKGSLYYYIHTKEDLLFEVISAVYEEGLAAILSAAATPGDPLERLERVIIAHVEQTCRNLVATAVYLHELTSLPTALRKKVNGRSYQGVFSELLGEAQEAGQLRPDVEPHLTMFWILGSTNWVYRWFDHRGQFTASKVALDFADLAINGVASKKALAARQRRRQAAS
jgi:TetR/AcrR family transcriptional regulator, cholesterol catabolism regulator